LLLVVGFAEFHAGVDQLLHGRRQGEGGTARFTDVAFAALDSHPRKRHQLVVENVDAALESDPEIGVGRGIPGS
jgi:hypothetical protein